MSLKRKLMEERRRKLEGMSLDELKQHVTDERARLSALEKKIQDALKWKPQPWQVIGVHSQCGGVGKTTISIALAQQMVERGKRVCIVDCNDEAPALQTYFPVSDDRKKTQWFFSEWFCRDDAQYMDIPDGLIQIIPGYNDLIGIVPNSMHSNDIDMLDLTQRGGRSPLGDYSYFQHRLMVLVSYLVKKKGFDSVIFDTNPGLAHLSYEILVAAACAGVSRVYVARPRPADIALLMMEDDVLFHPEMVAKSAIALNFYDADEEPTDKLIAEMMPEFPFFKQYANKLNCSTTGILKDYVHSFTANRLRALATSMYNCPCQLDKSTHIPYCPSLPQLHDTGSLGQKGSKYQYSSEVIRNAQEMQKLARQILDRLGVPKE